MSVQMDACGAGRRFHPEVWGRGLGWPAASPAETSHSLGGQLRGSGAMLRESLFMG